MKVKAEFDLSPDQLAAAFCEWDDDTQAQFFVECARIAAKWENGNAEMQWTRIGDHLRTCTCSTSEGREMIRLIYEALL